MDITKRMTKVVLEGVSSSVDAAHDYVREWADRELASGEITQEEFDFQLVLEDGTVMMDEENQAVVVRLGDFLYHITVREELAPAIPYFTTDEPEDVEIHQPTQGCLNLIREYYNENTELGDDSPSLEDFKVYLRESMDPERNTMEREEQLAIALEEGEGMDEADFSYWIDITANTDGVQA